MSLDLQAQELNETIRSTNPHVYDLLSDRGKAIFFPKRGILSQTEQAKGKKINATIGTALEDNGSPMVLDSLSNLLNLKNKEAFSYAPSYGRPDIRKAWKEHLFQKNRSLAGKEISLPVVSCALTHGLSMAGYLFVNENDTIISPDLYWENYDLVFGSAYGAKIDTFPLFVNNSSFNIEGLRNKLAGSPVGRKIVILNFPNNPTGYTVTENEALQIKDVLVDAANAGNNIVVFIDDAYFGLVYKEGILKESMFSFLADAHERILAVKFDGPTKEDYVWGFRVGFITFATALNSPAFYTALEAKCAGAIRGNISNATNIGQSLLITAYNNESYTSEKVAKSEMLRRRFLKIIEIFDSHKEYADYFYPLPFNSGYFMCVKLVKGDTDTVRRELLDKYNTGVIALGPVIRIAFSATPFDLLEELFENLYKASKSIAGA
ncbi:MAG: aminotransferase class I/II-fold pyridoxal phosphate-dependent enzyme [Fibrobacter sp.]|nr:aminotransferase class I/II-fold pyridoxal phosphate-dependent enzyme [Fibrobacter sp.]